jgi:hypothetical protein
VPVADSFFCHCKVTTAQKARVSDHAEEELRFDVLDESQLPSLPGDASAAVHVRSDANVSLACLHAI